LSSALERLAICRGFLYKVGIDCADQSNMLT
jgi:hypothetical protein